MSREILLLVDALAECRVVVVTDRVDLEGQLSRNFISGGLKNDHVEKTRVCIYVRTRKLRPGTRPRLQTHEIGC